MIKLFIWHLIVIALLSFATAAPTITKERVQKHAHTARAEVIDSIMLTVAEEAGKANGASVTNELGAIFKFIAGNHPASINAVNAIVQLSRNPQAKVDVNLGQTIFGKYPEYKAVAKQLEKLVKSSASSKAVAAFIPIALAQPEHTRLDDAEKYVREATKDKNAKPADVANSLYKQQQKQPLNFVTKANTKWVVDGSIAAMLAASGGDMIDISTFNEHLKKSHNSYLKDSNNVVIVF
ncbi:hypothetical protein [Parasitella parasitica]|uniref:Uncharacterized protein n=1 Tax=Parasitella parasitica TaxID=35722 RepID=A0A0B7NR02_9FUNG|nr:hypothetical protein [Parasitella parasitica]